MQKHQCEALICQSEPTNFLHEFVGPRNDPANEPLFALHSTILTGISSVGGYKNVVPSRGLNAWYAPQTVSRRESVQHASCQPYESTQYPTEKSVSPTPAIPPVVRHLRQPAGQPAFA